MKPPGLFYLAASKAACGIAAKNEANTLFAAPGGVPSLKFCKLVSRRFSRSRFWLNAISEPYIHPVRHRKTCPAQLLKAVPQ